MPDNPYQSMRPNSTSGGIRKMQEKEIRAMRSEWDEAHNPLPPYRDMREGIELCCGCGHYERIIGDQKELLSRSHYCKGCGKLVYDAKR